MPSGPFPKDEAYAGRLPLCIAVTWLDALNRALCVKASMGHPNVLGAKAYADAITAALAADLPAWKQRHAAVQHAP